MMNQSTKRRSNQEIMRIIIGDPELYNELMIKIRQSKMKTNLGVSEALNLHILESMRRSVEEKFPEKPRLAQEHERSDRTYSQWSLLSVGVLKEKMQVILGAPSKKGGSTCTENIRAMSKGILDGKLLFSNLTMNKRCSKETCYSFQPKPLDPKFVLKRGRSNRVTMGSEECKISGAEQAQSKPGITRTLESLEGELVADSHTDDLHESWSDSTLDQSFSFDFSAWDSKKVYGGNRNDDEASGLTFDFSAWNE